MAEGALVMYVDSLQSLLTSYPRLTNQLVSDSQGLVLFSSQPTLIAPNTILSDFNDSGYSFESVPWQNLTLYSIEPTLAAYKSVAWIGVVLAVMIIGFVLIILHMVKKTGALAENTLSNLYNDIKHKTRDGQRALPLSANEEAQELADIRNAFDNASTSFVKINMARCQTSLDSSFNAYLRIPLASLPIFLSPRVKIDLFAGQRLR